MDKIRYRTKTPVSFYLWILTTIFFASVAIVNSDNFWGPFVYILIFTAAIYWYFANFSGRLILTSDKIIVRYSITRFLNIEFPLEGISEYDYKKGFYDMISVKRYGVNDYVPKISYDTIMLKYKIKNQKGEIELTEQVFKINTRMFQLDRFLVELSKIKKINETDS